MIVSAHCSLQRHRIYHLRTHCRIVCTPPSRIGSCCRPPRDDVTAAGAQAFSIRGVAPKTKRQTETRGAFGDSLARRAKPTVRVRREPSLFFVVVVVVVDVARMRMRRRCVGWRQSRSPKYGGVRCARTQCVTPR